MNFNTIKEKHPKALSLLEEWLRGKANFVYDFNTRGLFEFFDKQEIYISAVHTKLGFHIGINYYKHGDLQDWYKHYYKTRTEAEEKGWEKAFSILTERLK